MCTFDAYFIKLFRIRISYKMNPTVYTQSDTTHRYRGVLTFHSEYRAQQWRMQDFIMGVG